MQILTTIAVISSLMIPPPNRVPLVEEQTVYKLTDGKPEAYLRQIVVWDLYWTVNGYELHVVDWLRVEECTTTIVNDKWLVMCTRNGRRIRVLAEHRIVTEGYVDVELLDRQSLSVYERRGLVEQ